MTVGYTETGQPEKNETDDETSCSVWRNWCSLLPWWLGCSRCMGEEINMHSYSGLSVLFTHLAAPLLVGTRTLQGHFRISKRTLITEMSVHCTYSSVRCYGVQLGKEETNLSGSIKSRSLYKDEFLGLVYAVRNPIGYIASCS